MSAPYYYFFNATAGTTYPVDTNLITMTLPTISRNYTVQNLFSDGAIITGNGSMQAGIISVTKKFSKSIYTTAWNTLRTQLMSVYGLAKSQILYFYIQTSDGLILRQRVYPMTKGAENYTNIAISDAVQFDFQMEKAYWYNTVNNSVTYNVLTSQLETFTINNIGVLNTAPVFTFTPTGNFSSMTISTASGNYGFTLAASFLASQPITFDCGTGTITVNGVVTTGIQSAGSVFNVIPGLNVIYITATAGTIIASWPERYI